MSWRRTLLSGILAAGLMQAYVPGVLVSTAHADQDDHHHDGDRDHDHDWDHDHDQRSHSRGYDRDQHHDHARWSDDYSGHDRGYDRDGHHDHARWSNEYTDRDHGHDGRGKGDNTKDCWAIRDRIRYDRDQVAKIEPTGRHRKAMQWYKDDIQNAQNDMRTCRR
jgi:hypothetical protein